MALGISREDWYDECDREDFVERAKIKEKKLIAYLKALSPEELQAYKTLQRELWLVAQEFPRKYK